LDDAFNLSAPNSLIEHSNEQAGSRKRRKAKRALERAPEMCQGGKWTEEEHNRFLVALEIYGNIWKKVEEYIGTRSRAQIRSHAQKYFRGMRAKMLAQLKKTGHSKKAVFLVVREYRNYTYCQPPSNALPIQGETISHVTSPALSASTKEDQKEEMISKEKRCLPGLKDLEMKGNLAQDPSNAIEEDNSELQDFQDAMIFNAQEFALDSQYNESDFEVEDVKRPFWEEENGEGFS